MAGIFNLVITATDSEGNMVDVPLVYQVTDPATTPAFLTGFGVDSLVLNPDIFNGFDNAEKAYRPDVAAVFLDAIGFTNFTLDLANLNVGALATSWEIVDNANNLNLPIVTEHTTGSTVIRSLSEQGVSISNTGVLTVSNRPLTVDLTGFGLGGPIFPVISHTIDVRAINANGSSLIKITLVYDTNAFFIQVRDGFNQTNGFSVDLTL